MKFPYKKFLGRSHRYGKLQSVCRPVIPIHLSSRNSRISYEALVDSGADYSIFHAEIGELLGLNVKRGEPVTFTGVAGFVREGFRHPIQIGVGDHRFLSSIVFAQGLSVPYGILGQAEFFKHFLISFNRNFGWLRLSGQR